MESLYYGDKEIKKIMYGGREIRPEPPIIDYIELKAVVTAANQTVKVNKYFANAHNIDWWDGSPVANHTADTTHTYSAAGTYKIKLTLAWWATRWTFVSAAKPLVPTAGTTASNIYISSMPSLADYFGANATNPGDNFFYCFNYIGALTSLPAGSFILSQLPVASRNNYFSYFNSDGKLTKQVWGIQIKNAHNAAINFDYWNWSYTVSESVSSWNSFNWYTVW